MVVSAVWMVVWGDNLADLAFEVMLVKRPVAGIPEPRLSGLTEREAQVLALVGHGLSNAEISAELNLSVATVKTHVGHLLAKTRARDSVQAVVLAYETGLVVPGRRT
jgi:DNA-binding NarL/FixJ family response regulator